MRAFLLLVALLIGLAPLPAPPTMSPPRRT